MVGPERRPPERNRHESRIREVGEGTVRVVVGLKDDDVLTRFDEAEHGGGQRFRGPYGHQHLAVGIKRDAAETKLVLGDRQAKVGSAPGRWILVLAPGDGLDRLVEQFPRTRVVGNPWPRFTAPVVRASSLISPNTVPCSSPLGERRPAPWAARSHGPSLRMHPVCHRASHDRISNRDVPTKPERSLRPLPRLRPRMRLDASSERQDPHARLTTR